MKNKRVLVTGGGGFIGSALARECLKQGAEVEVLVRHETDTSKLNGLEDKFGERFKVLRGDLSEPRGAMRPVEDKDYIFHLAWQTDLKKAEKNPREDLRTNVDGTLALLETCRKINPSAKIVFASTVTICVPLIANYLNEKTPDNPSTIYDINKLSAEHFMREYFQRTGLKTSVLRLSNIFGPGQKTNNPNRGILNYFVGRAVRGEPLEIYGDGHLIRDYLYVGDCADAFIAAAESDETNGRKFVIGSGNGKSFQRVVEDISRIYKKISGKDAQICYSSFPENSSPIDERSFAVDSSAFREATGWKPKVGFRDGLYKTMMYAIEENKNRK